MDLLYFQVLWAWRVTAFEDKLKYCHLLVIFYNTVNVFKNCDHIRIPFCSLWFSECICYAFTDVFTSVAYKEKTIWTEISASIPLANSKISFKQFSSVKREELSLTHIYSEVSPILDRIVACQSSTLPVLIQLKNSIGSISICCLQKAFKAIKPFLYLALTA